MVGSRVINKELNVVEMLGCIIMWEEKIYRR